MGAHPKASSLRGGGSAKPRRRGRRKFAATSQSASQTAPLKGEPWIFAPRKKVQIIQIFTVPSIDGNRSKATSIKFDTPVSGGAYQDIRKVITEWNARPKHCGPPKIKGSMHPASPSTLFSPIFSLAREKIGPPEARQKRPRRNESLQARLLILCARFFLSKPQTEFAVWVFSQICNNLSVSFADSSPGRGSLCLLRRGAQNRLRCASSSAGGSGWASRASRSLSP